MMPILQVGPVAIPLPTILILLGIWLGISLAERHAHHYTTDPDQLFNMALIALVSGVIAARLTYVARFPSAFSQNPLDIFSRNLGLFDPIGGLVFGTIIATIYAQRKGMRLWPTLDALTPAFAVLALAYGFAHLASGEAFGAATSLPWGVEWWNARRHPSQIYEIFGAALILFIFLPGRRNIAPSGVYFLYFVCLTSGLHLFLEAFRGDSPITIWGLRVPQIVAWVLLAAGLWLAAKRAGSHSSIPGTSSQEN